tara:strand:- start:35760 stop:37016 length:1257 start_codon:yes stop_codon:yes gene_type:complete
MTNTIAYAIDFGTSNSLLAAINKDGSHEILFLEENSSIMKSLSYYLNEEEYYFGSNAIEEYEANSFEGRFVRSVKKFLPNPNFESTRIGDRHYLLESLVGFFLKEMKERADKILGQKINNVILGRPAKYSLDIKEDRLAQERMHRAAMIAGFQNIDFFAEPLAAAKEFPMNRDWQNLLVMDIGAGTSDFSWVEKTDSDNLKVHALNAIPIAGDAFDGDIMQYGLAKYFAAELQYSLPMSSTKLSMPAEIKYRLRSPADICFMTKGDIQDFLRDLQTSNISEGDRKYLQNLEIVLEDNLAFNLYQHIERSKIRLSNGENHHFNYQYPGIDIDQALIESEFQSWIASNISKIRDTMMQTVNMAGKQIAELDLVLITGGSSQLPSLHQALASEIDSDKFYRPENFMSVVRGLAKHAFEVYK